MANWYWGPLLLLHAWVWGGGVQDAHANGARSREVVRDGEEESACGSWKCIQLPVLFFGLTVLPWSQKLCAPLPARRPCQAPRACPRACCCRAAGRRPLLERSSRETARRRMRSGCSRWSCCVSPCSCSSSSSSSSWPAAPCPPSAGGILPACTCWKPEMKDRRREGKNESQCYSHLNAFKRRFSSCTLFTVNFLLYLFSLKSLIYYKGFFFLQNKICAFCWFLIINQFTFETQSKFFVSFKKHKDAQQWARYFEMIIL